MPRYWCKVCEKAFSARVRTVLYRQRMDEEMITHVVTFGGHCCPVMVIEASYGLQAQTIREWMEASDKHIEAVHHVEVVHPRDLRQV